MPFFSRGFVTLSMGRLLVLGGWFEYLRKCQSPGNLMHKSQGFTEYVGSSVGNTGLLLRVVRGEWPVWFKLTGR